jgi:aldose 1-epimerase
VNLSHHSFFNLKGEGNGTINDHVLYINGSYITPVNDVLIPSGEIADVTGTPFDFRTPKAIGTDLDAENEQLLNGNGYDHNWVLDRKSENESDLELAASVYEPASGRFMTVHTNQPAIQFYGGNFFDGTTTGKYGKTLNYRESIALETQKYPDTPNHPHFPSTLLNPGENYTHICIYKFSVR